mmetsp:Transcript_19665/g.60826  ORF Transcript_19665/g.60826 Transcript_19665/m.60826 type:complete len:539 (-) Transcript_19665:146-1762(-)
MGVLSGGCVAAVVEVVVDAAPDVAVGGFEFGAELVRGLGGVEVDGELVDEVVDVVEVEELGHAGGQHQREENDEERRALADGVEGVAAEVLKVRVAEALRGRLVVHGIAAVVRVVVFVGRGIPAAAAGHEPPSPRRVLVRGGAGHDVAHVGREDEGGALAADAELDLEVAEEVAEVDVHEAARGRHHDVVGVPVAHAEDVGRHAVARARRDESGSRAFEAAGVGVVRLEVGEDDVVFESALGAAAELDLDGCGRAGVAHDFDHAAAFAGRDAAVRAHLELQTTPPPEPVHHSQQLQRQLVLPQVVAVLVNEVEVVSAGVRVPQHDEQRLLLGRQHAALADVNARAPQAGVQARREACQLRRDGPRVHLFLPSAPPVPAHAQRETQSFVMMMLLLRRPGCLRHLAAEEPSLPHAHVRPQVLVRLFEQTFEAVARRPERFPLEAPRDVAQHGVHVALGREVFAERRPARGEERREHDAEALRNGRRAELGPQKPEQPVPDRPRRAGASSDEEPRERRVVPQFDFEALHQLQRDGAQLVVS